MVVHVNARLFMLRHSLLPPGALLAAAASLGLLMPAGPAGAQVLYSLDTRCSLNGGVPQPCTVEAINQPKLTEYRHRIGNVTETVRISDSPVRMQRWDGTSKQWQSLSWAAARFSTNTVCFNGRQLCVVNPNYLNSVRQQSPSVMTGRDLVKVHFGADGRIDATCYDNGCEVKLQ